MMGMLFALAIALSYLENMLPPIAGAVPGIKLGLSNIVTMYCLFIEGPVSALLLAVLKGGAVTVTRGLAGGALSLCGGLCSVAVMLLCNRLKSKNMFTSVMGAVAHNIGQLVAASLLVSSAFALYYIPVLVISGVAMGIITSLIYKAISPALEKLNSQKKNESWDDK